MSKPTEVDLDMLRNLTAAASPAPWRSMIEGRDHTSGDTFIMIGEGDDRGEDLYLSRDSGPANGTDHDFIAAARNWMEELLDEIEGLRVG